MSACSGCISELVVVVVVVVRGSWDDDGGDVGSGSSWGGGIGGGVSSWTVPVMDCVMEYSQVWLVMVC